MRNRATLIIEMLRRSWGVAPVASAVITVVILAQSGSVAVNAAVQRSVVDQVGRGAMTSIVIITVAGLAIAYGAGAAGNRIQTNLRGIITEKINIDLSDNVLRWTTGTPHLDQFDSPAFLDRLHRVRSDTQKLAGISWNMVSTVALALGLTASLVLLAQVNLWLMLMAVLAVPPFVLGGRSRRFIRDAEDAVAPLERQEVELHGYVSSPELAKELRVSNNEEVIDQRCDELWNRTRRITGAAHVHAAAYAYVGWLVFAAGYLTAVAGTIWLVTQQRATLGELTLVITLGQQLRWQVLFAVWGVTNMADGGHVAQHYDWLRQHHAATREAIYPTSAPDRVREGITVGHLSFTYADQDRPAVDDVSVHLPAGSVVALLGENGAGKTTLVKLLLGQYVPDYGTVRIDDTDLQTIKPAEWATRCSGLVQDFAKLQGPVRDAVGAGGLSHLTKAEIRHAIDQAHASSIVDSLPRGIDTELGIAFGTHDLSHGQWQRLALGRGLTRPAPLLMVLDEPTSALDPEVEHQLFDAFFNHARQVAATYGSIALIVSHRLSTTQDADLILVMDHGKIVESGHHNTLIANSSRYRDLYQLQSRAYR